MIDEHDFLSYMTLRLKQTTITTRKSRFHIFENWRNEQDITPKLIEDFFLYLKFEKHLSNTSLNTYYHTLKTVERYCKHRGIENPFMQGLEPFPEDEVNIEPLTNQEAQNLIETHMVPLKGGTRALYMEKVNYCLTVFLLHTGCRWEEGRDLQIKHLDFLENKVTFEKTKNRGIRRIYIVEPLLSLLKEMAAEKQVTDYVFSNSVGNRIYYPDFYENLCKRKNLTGITKPLSPHKLRHSWSNSLYDQTNDIYLVKEAIGHRNITTTQRYVRVGNERMKNAQLSHPYHIKVQQPRLLINIIQEQINATHIEENKRFDYGRVKRAINVFISNLTEAIV